MTVLPGRSTPFSEDRLLVRYGPHIFSDAKGQVKLYDVVPLRLMPSNYSNNGCISTHLFSNKPTSSVHGLETSIVIKLRPTSRGDMAPSEPQEASRSREQHSEKAAARQQREDEDGDEDGDEDEDEDVHTEPEFGLLAADAERRLFGTS